MRECCLVLDAVHLCKLSLLRFEKKSKVYEVLDRLKSPYAYRLYITHQGAFITFFLSASEFSRSLRVYCSFQVVHTYPVRGSLYMSLKCETQE